MAKKEYRRIPEAELVSIIETAIAEGRHGRPEDFRRLCRGRGGHWVAEIWTVTLDKKELCRQCAEGR